MTLFRLKSNEPALPDFAGRWDIRENAVDVDLRGDTRASTIFKKQSDGYRGHHSRDLGDHRYAIDIALPGFEVFRGTLELDARGIVHLRNDVSSLIEGITDTLSVFNADTGEKLKIV